MRYCLFVLAFVGLLTSCDNDLDLTAEYKDITIIYGMLNSKEDTQFIRIQKAFLGDGNALLYAQEPDSSYYPDSIIRVVMRRYLPNGTLTDTTVLQRIPNNQPKDDGIFFTTPNYLYIYTNPIFENSTYELVLHNLNSGKKVSAKTKIARSPLITYPPNSSAIINFEANAALPGANPAINFTWLKSDNVVAYQFVFTFRYEEFPVSNPSEATNKSFHIVSPVFNPFLDEPNANEIRFAVFKRDFYNWVLAHIHQNQNLARRFQKIDITVYASTKEFYDYYTINSPSSSIVQKTSDYTNINNGFGLFSSRISVSTPNVSLHQNTLDSLRAGQFTSHLNFVD